MEAKRKVRVLVVDDSESIRLFVRTLMISMGSEVVGEAANGREALELFDSLAPDLVLLDINMPVMDGISALKEIRARSQKVAVVMLSALSSLDVVQVCLDAGANYHLRKDLSVEQLRREIGETWQWLAHITAQGGSLY